MTPTRILASAALLTVLAAPAPADDTMPPLTRLETHLDFSLDYAFNTDMDGPGEVSVTRANADIEAAWQLTSKIIGTLYVGTEWTWYNFKNATGLNPGPPDPDPFDLLVDTTIRPGMIFNWTEQWAVVAGGIFEITGELGADVGDSLRAGGYAGVRWQQNKQLAWTLGVTATTRLEDSVQVFPLVGVEWAVSDTVNVSVRGPAARVTTRLDEEWSFTLDAAYQSREYRLEDDSTNPSGVIRDVRVPVAAGFIWKPNDAKGLELTIKAGAVVYQEYEALLNGGASIGTFNSDMTPFVYLGGTWRF